MLGDTIMKGATPEEIGFFGEVCKRTGLDPFRKQIHAVKRWDSRAKREIWTFQTGIDGFRAIAHRTKACAGIDDAVFNPSDESTEFPRSAKVTVYRIVGGQRVPFTATARWSEYVQTTKEGHVTSMWQKLPYSMLAKTAEALALRKAFPEDLSGIHSDEEMAQAENPEKPPVSVYKLKELEEPAQAQPEPAAESPKRQQAVDAEVIPPETKLPTATLPVLAVPDFIAPFTGGRWKAVELPEGGILGKKSFATIGKLRETLPEPIRGPILATFIDNILALLKDVPMTEEDFSMLAFDRPEFDLSFSHDLWMNPAKYAALLTLAQSLKPAS
jgi:phage recombination protein Bet